MTKKILIYLFPLLFACASATTQETTKIHEKKLGEPNTCQLIEKEFVNKGGKITEYKELYLRCSIQDYFIKLCESKVTKKELEKYLNKGITIEMEIKEGMWDHCNDNPAYAQSRVGNYVIIKKIIE